MIVFIRLFAPIIHSHAHTHAIANRYFGAKVFLGLSSMPERSPICTQFIQRVACCDSCGSQTRLGGSGSFGRCSPRCYLMHFETKRSTTIIYIILAFSFTITLSFAHSIPFHSIELKMDSRLACGLNCTDARSLQNGGSALRLRDLPPPYSHSTPFV